MSDERKRSIDFAETAPSSSAAGSGPLGRAGLALLRDVIDGRVPAAPVQATLGFELVDAADGFSKFELTPGKHLHGPFGVVHGGITATLLDAAMGAAAMTTLDAATTCATASLSLHYTRAISERTTKVIAEGWVVHRGSRVVTTEGRLTDEDGRLFAHGSATFLLSERKRT